MDNIMHVQKLVYEEVYEMAFNQIDNRDANILKSKKGVLMLKK